MRDQGSRLRNSEVDLKQAGDYSGEVERLPEMLRGVKIESYPE